MTPSPPNSRSYGWEYPELEFDGHGFCTTLVDQDMSRFPLRHRFYRHDRGLFGGLRYFLGEQTCMADFGCGDAWYARRLDEDTELHCRAYDGNPHTPVITGGFGDVLDLAVPVDLGQKFSCVTCLNVGEYVHDDFASVFIDNVVRHSSYIVVMAWGSEPGQGVVNPRDVLWLKDRLHERGLQWYEEGEEYLRGTVSEVFDLKRSLTVFIK